MPGQASLQISCTACRPDRREDKALLPSPMLSGRSSSRCCRQPRMPGPCGADLRGGGRVDFVASNRRVGPAPAAGQPGIPIGNKSRCPVSDEVAAFRLGLAGRFRRPGRACQDCRATMRFVRSAGRRHTDDKAWAGAGVMPCSLRTRSRMWPQNMAAVAERRVRQGDEDRAVAGRHGAGAVRHDRPRMPGRLLRRPARTRVGLRAPSRRVAVRRVLRFPASGQRHDPPEPDAWHARPA